MPQMVINRTKGFKKEKLHLELLSLMDKWIGFSTSFALLFGNLRLYESTLYHVVIHDQNKRYNNKYKNNGRKYIRNNYRL